MSPVKVLDNAMVAPSSQLTQLTADTFWEFVPENRFAVIHFRAAWNGQDFPILKVLEETAERASGGVAIAQLDVEPPAHYELSRSHNVLNALFLIFYRNGRLVRTQGCKHRKLLPTMFESFGTSPWLTFLVGSLGIRDEN